MIRWHIVAVAFAVGLLLTVWLSLSDDDTYELGRGADHVPSVQPGFEAIDNVPTIPPGVRAVSSRSAKARPSEDIWWQLFGCETGGTYDPRIVSATGRFRGAFQFDLDSWRRAGGTGDPIDHSYEVQLAVAQTWQRLVGWGAWPYCSRKLGLR